MAIKWLAFQPLIGGMDLGAEKAFGCPPTAILDYDGIGNSDLYEHYMNVIKGNSLKHYHLNGGVYSLTEEFKPLEKENNDPEIPNWNYDCFKNLDVVVGVPICAGLSSANCQSASSSETGMGRGSEATQNNNMIGMLNITMKYLKPKVYIFENAVKLATKLGVGIKEKLEKIANDNGYGVTLVKVNTMNHGLPQNRPRTFMICVKDSNAPKLEFNPVPIPKIMDILKDLPADASTESCEVRIGDRAYIRCLKDLWGPDYRTEWLRHNTAADLALYEMGILDKMIDYFDTEKEKNRVRRYLEKAKQGLGWMSFAPVYCGEDKIPSLYGRSMGRIWHPVEERNYTIRECMRLMGLPDDFPEVSQTNKGMIGQNVPVCTAEYYCNEVKKYLEGKLKIADTQNLDLDFNSSIGYGNNHFKKQKNIPTGFNKFMK